MTDPLFPDLARYNAFFDALKTRIRMAQLRASLAVNQELMLLYWHIGQEILKRQQEEGWGGKVVSKLPKGLKREFPDMKGKASRGQTCSTCEPLLKLTRMKQ